MIVNLKTSPNLTSEELLYDRFEFKKYEISRFHGLNFFVKILLDKNPEELWVSLACAHPAKFKDTVEIASYF